MNTRLDRAAARGRGPATRSLPGLALSSTDASRHASYASPGNATPRDEARMLANWESRCARTLPARSGRVADEPARMLSPGSRGRGD